MSYPGLGYTQMIAVLVAALGLTTPQVEPSPARSVAPERAGGITGAASWYAYHVGQAAAGPALRRLLGPDWRGQTVTVTRGTAHVDVVLTDWCQCYEDETQERIIDLDINDFASLGPTSHGVIDVTVTWP